MATARRRQSFTVIERLRREPYRFDFFQSVRLLERASMIDGEDCASETVAGSAPPSRELVRFHAQSSLSFVGSDVLKIEQGESADADKGSALKQWQMDVGFTGLAGSQGVMPYYLTELVQKELREKNTALRDFLDIFNHRHISLLYQAWHKYQLPANYERQHLRRDREPDLFSHALASLSGLGTSEMRYRMPMPDESLLGMAGHLGRQQCSAAALASMIRQHFGLNVSIEQFRGEWDELPEDVLCRLPGPGYPQGINNRLGTNSVLGIECFQAQNKFRVVVEPLAYEQFMTIAPGSEKLEALKSFIQFSAGVEMDFEISVTLSTGQVAPVQLVDETDNQPLLGWNAHMGGDQQEQRVDITLSADRVSPDEALPSA
ncbi:type VI secretion system baseplate subunit TssG [Microbulbifer halophilus]|uniref:Type VI secretion system baseplate subunit TssG n=1 Tax=Microbulbifer halophilus TaxID=453963 RepID=A0ABW5EAW7_9GAMM|nr:type VI secretion system baseplate subunit TssG [Microbulbifer halophilus]MCW8128148.1 type VI secretion system baseplate subunit TssG [Microbulbifer halophilus]